MAKVTPSNRVDLLNYLVDRFGYRRYLEIGVSNDDLCFKRINCAEKTGVDPESGGTLRMTSDQFFAQTPKDRHWDLIFVDGLHQCEQVNRDLVNSLRHLAKNGTIVMHDCNPEREEEATYPPDPRGQRGVWNGDTWKAYASWRTRHDVDVVCADFDWGCGVIRARPNSSPWVPGASWRHDFRNLTWSDLVHHRRALLRLKTFQEIEAWL